MSDERKIITLDEFRDLYSDNTLTEDEIRVSRVWTSFPDASKHTDAQFDAMVRQWEEVQNEVTDENRELKAKLDEMYKKWYDLATSKNPLYDENIKLSAEVERLKKELPSKDWKPLCYWVECSKCAIVCPYRYKKEAKQFPKISYAGDMIKEEGKK